MHASDALNFCWAQVYDLPPPPYVHASDALNFYWAAQILLKLSSKWRDADGVGDDAAEGHYYTGWTDAARRGQGIKHKARAR